MMEKINVPQKLSLINDHWNPRIAGSLNGQHVKLVKLKGEFVWHSHEREDEMFYVLTGRLKIEFRDRMGELCENEFIIIPKGVEHRPVAEAEVAVMRFEPETTLNTGDKRNTFTRDELQQI